MGNLSHIRLPYVNLLAYCMSGRPIVDILKWQGMCGVWRYLGMTPPIGLGATTGKVNELLGALWGRHMEEDERANGEGVRGYNWILR